MAGTVTCGTISDGTNSTSSTNCIQGSAKAWVLFDGTSAPPTIRGQYNVGSITKNATGDYTVSFTNALSSANYSVVGSCIGSSGNWAYNVGTKNSVLSAGSVRFVVTYTNGDSNFDVPYVSITCFR